MRYGFYCWCCYFPFYVCPGMCSFAMYVFLMRLYEVSPLSRRIPLLPCGGYGVGFGVGACVYCMQGCLVCVYYLHSSSALACRSLLSQYSSPE